jgi:hypothetical protein
MSTACRAEESMPRYYFNIDNSIGYLADEEGRELAGPDEARREALKGARSILAEDVLQGKIDLRGRLEVKDEAGRIVLTLPFSEAVELLR